MYNEIKRGTFIARGKLWQDERRYGYDVGQRIHKENMSRRGRKRKLSVDDSFLSDVASLILDQKYSPEAALYTLSDHYFAAVIPFSPFRKVQIAAIKILKKVQKTFNIACKKVQIRYNIYQYRRYTYGTNCLAAVDRLE